MGRLPVIYIINQVCKSQLETHAAQEVRDEIYGFMEGALPLLTFT